MNERSKQVRRDAIALMLSHGGYHYGGSFSCAEILIALFDRIIKNKDIVILSKGHGCWCYYVLLREKGFNPKIEKHPHRDPANGIHVTTGSMGHGLPFGIGLALAKEIKGEPGHVYVIMSDGELQEGTTWESLLILNKLALVNLTIIIDRNGIQASDTVAKVIPVNTSKILSDAYFGGSTNVNGHDVDSLKEALSTFNFIVAFTTKGKGVSFMENSVEWGAKWLDGDDFKRAVEELS